MPFRNSQVAISGSRGSRASGLFHDLHVGQPHAVAIAVDEFLAQRRAGEAADGFHLDGARIIARLNLLEAAGYACTRAAASRRVRYRGHRTERRRPRARSFGLSPRLLHHPNCPEPRGRPWETLCPVTERRHGAAGGSVGRSVGALSLGSGSNRLGAFCGASWVKLSRRRCFFVSW